MDLFQSVEFNPGGFHPARGNHLRPVSSGSFRHHLIFAGDSVGGMVFRQAGCWLGRLLKQRWVSILVIIMLVAGWIGWDFPLNADIVNPVTVLVTQADLDALEWVEENTPRDARFLINTAHWLSGVYRGVDGGGWLLPYTGRWAIVPTVFYGFSQDAAYKQAIRRWGQEASTLTTCSDEFWALVDAADLADEANYRHPDDPLVLWWTARLLAEMGDHVAAARRIERLLAYGPEGPSTHGSLGYDRKLFGAYGWAMLGVCRLAKGDPHGALEWLRRAEAADSSNTEIRVKRAYAEALIRARAS